MNLILLTFKFRPILGSLEVTAAQLYNTECFITCFITNSQ